MKINRLNLKNFRNYLDLDIEFNDKLNIIIGNNAQGKTNILEAIYFLSITKSFLSVNEKTLIHKDKDFTRVNGDIFNGNFKKNLAVKISNDGKKIEVNKKLIKRNIDYLGNLRVIIFSPDDIRLLKDSPGNRRRFLNIELSQLYDKYIKILSEFNIILKQRNEYLKIIKNSPINLEYFNILNEKYVDLSVSIYLYRFNFIDKVNQYISDKYSFISGDDGLLIKYISDIDITDKNTMKNIMLNKLSEVKDREIMYGNTQIGPHKDNFSFYLNENNLLLYGSQGQLKMSILALKLAEIDVFKEVTGEMPILLLDDIFSELDIEKRNKLIKFLNDDVQTIMTTTDLSEIDQELVKIANIYKIENGKIIEKINNN
ncbi:MAG: DNA replication/repair protein RecF [Bacilli bacterium]|nr:DNA replication/repair protein RecF [Bacilli bacterium]